jgi:hypothetical protein
MVLYANHIWIFIVNVCEKKILKKALHLYHALNFGLYTIVIFPKVYQCICLNLYYTMMLHAKYNYIAIVGSSELKKK